MEYEKQSLSSYFDDENDSKRKHFKKTTVHSNNSFRKYITHFEDLSNDIIYEIFDYLDFPHVYEAFGNLNIRFRNLLRNSNLPILINIPFMSKSSSQTYYTDIILHNAHRIKSLHSSNPFSIYQFSTQEGIFSKLIRLENLILNNIHLTDFDDINNCLVSLPCLSSLVIVVKSNQSSCVDRYRQIFRLPVLKYCKISLNTWSGRNALLPVATNEFSPIEYFFIDNIFPLCYLYPLLSYVPQLRHLSIAQIKRSLGQQNNPYSIKLNHLTHASLCLQHIHFHEFESLTKNLFSQLQVLHITIHSDEPYLDANRWERLILSYMSYLRIFDVQLVFFSHRNFYSPDIFTIEPFPSQFWLERQWFFTSTVESEGFDHYRIHFSTNPHRRKSFRLYRSLNTDMLVNEQKNNIDSVHHVYIQQEQTINNCRNYFPNATELTLSYGNVNVHQIPPSILLNHIVPVTQLTKLNISIDPFLFKTMIELLSLTPNIHTLTLARMNFLEKDFTIIEQTETFQLVSAGNNIKHLTIMLGYTCEQIKFLIHLCPRLQCLTMHAPTNHFEETLRYLLSKDTRHLFFLCVTNVSENKVNFINSLIESNKGPDDYLMKQVIHITGVEICLWW